jgi:hypothetical protein
MENMSSYVEFTGRLNKGEMRDLEKKASEVTQNSSPKVSPLSYNCIKLNKFFLQAEGGNYDPSELYAVICEAGCTITESRTRRV